VVGEWESWLCKVQWRETLQALVAKEVAIVNMRVLYTTAVEADTAGGGGISGASSFRFLPLGAGSRAVLLYVTVLVTTDRTLTGRMQPLLGASKYLCPLLSRFQSAGENGERPMLALIGDGALPGVWSGAECKGDCGIRSRLKPAELARVCAKAEDGVGGAPLGDLMLSHLQEEKLLEVDGSDVGVFLPEESSDERLLGSALNGCGLVSTGVNALRKSVYALGGVIGVFKSSSCLMTQPTPDSGVLRRSEGKEADFGVWRGGSTGLLAAGILSTRTSGSSSERVTELPDDGSGVRGDGEGVEEARESRDEGEREGGR
jgi:hypothetical protein